MAWDWHLEGTGMHHAGEKAAILDDRRGHRGAERAWWLALAELALAGAPGVVLALLGVHGALRPAVMAASAIIVVALAWAALRREAQLRAVLGRLAHASGTQLGEGLLGRRRDVVHALESLSVVHAEEMAALRSGMRRLSEEEQRIRIVLEHVAPASFRCMFPGLDVAAASAARGRCGGDWYVARELGYGQTLIAAGDVAGHDPASAYVAAAISGALRVLPKELVLEEPARVLARLARLVEDLSDRQLTSTCVLATVDVVRKHVIFVNAGHPAPWILRGGVVVESLAASAAPLGLGGGASYATRTARLEVGDRLVFFSDGVIEQMNPHGREFGLRRLRDATQNGIHGVGVIDSQQLLDDILKGFREFARTSRLCDDVSMLVCSVLPIAPELASVGVDDVSTDVTLDVPAARWRLPTM
jgi:serine phosphatase RsbU (regulator of sigma subunit)